MQALLALALATSSVGSESPRTYLASVNIDLGPHESLSEFKLDTWGVQFNAVCRIPSGWFVQAGSDAILKGSLKGEGSHGATWLTNGTLRELRGLVLITMWGPVQRADAGPIPATFQGYAVIGDGAKRLTLSYRNVRLTPAKGCPT
jgi:hypothetical protein